MDVATLTLSPSLDAEVEVDTVRAEDKLRTGPPRFDVGGGGVNVARVLDRLGHAAVAVLPAGGRTGQRLADLLAGDVAVEAVPAAAEARTNLTVRETSTGDQYRFVLPGSHLDEREWRACLDRLDAADVAVVVASGSVPPGVPDDVYAQVVQRARERGRRVVVDTSGEPLRAAAGARPFLVKPNVRELEHLCGRPLEGSGDLPATVLQLVDDGVAEVVVVSLGAGGALVAGAGLEPTHLPAPVVPIASKVGAGDSMVAGIVAGLLRGEPVLEAVRRGLAAGAAAVMTPGTELARAEDVARLLATTARP